MKKKLLFVFGLFCFISTSSQEKVELNNFTESLCNCINKMTGTKDEVLKKCVLELANKDTKIIEIVKKIGDKEGNINYKYWSKVNVLLSSNCDSYNILIMESFVDKNQSFPPIIKSIADDVCLKLSSIKELNDDNIRLSAVPFLKKNQQKLLKIYSSPKEVVKSLNNYLALNCKKYRTFMSLSTAQEKF